MQETGLNRGEVIKLLKKARERDLSYEEDRVLSSMCTSPLPIAEKAHSMFIKSNLGDPGLSKGSISLEKKSISMMSSLLNLEDGEGYITTGGTESNIQALRIFKKLSPETNPEIIVPKSAHFSFFKAADILGIDIKQANLDLEFRVDLNSIENLLTDRTIGLVGVAGTTETGQVDPINKLSKIAKERNIFLHVDAAFGGFVLPFLQRKFKFDFSNKAVDSMTIDPHKMGLSTVPAGGLLVREEAMLKSVTVKTPYLTSRRQHSLLGTRTGTGAASAFAVMKFLGKKGFKEIIEKCMEKTWKLANEVKEMENADLTIDPVINLVSIKCDRPEKKRKKLLERGWNVSISETPKAVRVVIMPHVKIGEIKDFIEDLAEIL